MSMTDKEQFRFRFLEKCAAAGLAPDQVRELSKRLVKVADMGWLGTLLKAPLQYSGAKILGGAGLGIAGGYGLAKMTEEDVDPEIVKKYEVIAALQQQAERARRQAARVSYRPVRSIPRVSQTV